MTTTRIELAHETAYAEAIDAMLIAIAKRDERKLRVAREMLAAVMRDAMVAAEVVGALAVLRAAAAAHIDDPIIGMRSDRVAMVRFRDGGELPRVTFDEALADLVSRTPVTIRKAAERTADKIAALYSTDRVIAFARSAEKAVTERVQALIADGIRDGWTEIEAGGRIVAGVDEIRRRTAAWTDAYARLAFRNNVQTATTAGRFRQAADPDVRRVVPAFRFDAIGDSDTRENHAAANGVILRQDNPQWGRIAPPLGHNCRCTVVHVTAPELRRMGRMRADGSVVESVVPMTARPDDGFRHVGRPDLAGVP